MKEIAILLATYNSEKYIRCQIDSIINQSIKNWSLYIHDDQSSDKTQSIIKAYCKHHSNIFLLDDATNRGSKKSFAWLLQKVEAKYYMFCDHDDFWLPNKVERAYELMKKFNNENIPTIVACNAKIVDSNLNTLVDSLWYSCGFRKSDFSNKYFHLFYNNMPGCTLMFNHCVKEISLPMAENTTYIHDSWIINKTLWNKGRILRIPDTLILYRQHENNLIGMKESPSFLKQIMKIKTLTKKTWFEYKASKVFCKRIPFFVFFAIKTYFLILLHITTKKRKHDTHCHI